MTIKRSKDPNSVKDMSLIGIKIRIQLNIYYLIGDKTRIHKKYIYFPKGIFLRATYQVTSINFLSGNFPNVQFPKG